MSWKGHQMTYSYIAFQKPGCPNCGQVQDLIGKYDIKGSIVNGESAYGKIKAKQYNVKDLPTVIFFDQGLPFRCDSQQEVQRFLNLFEIPHK